MPTAKLVYNENKKIRKDYAYLEKLWKDGQRIINLFKQTINIKNKMILDVGCGGGGKTTYYARDAKYVVGCDIDKIRLERAKKFSERKGLSQKTRFIYSESTDIPFSSNTFDVIIMNDVMEHFIDPLNTLMESKRVLKKGGFICINFAAWLSSYGSHLNDWIYIPWCQVFFSEKTLIKVLKKLSLSEKYIGFQFPNINKKPLPTKLENLGSGNLNKITLKKFKKILSETELEIVHFELKGMKFKNGFINLISKYFAKIPFLNEFFGGEIIVILKKS